MPFLSARTDRSASGLKLTALRGLAVVAPIKTRHIRERFLPREARLPIPAKIILDPVPRSNIVVLLDDRARA